MEKKPLIARLKNGSLRCPICDAQLAKIYYGGYCCGVEVKCNRGHSVWLEAKTQK